MPINEILFATPFHYGWIIFHLPVFIEIIALASLFIVFFKKLWREKMSIFLALFTILSFIMITNLFPWKFTPSILQTLQFPWRLSLYMMFGAILFCGIGINYFKDKRYFNIICIVLLVFSLFSCYYYIGHPDNEAIDLNNIDYVRGMGNEKEYLPVKAENLYYEFVVHEGNGEFSIIEDDVPLLVFDAKIENECKIELPRIYYPGYKLVCNGNSIKLEEGENGYIQANIRSSGTYTLIYEKTIVMKVSWLITLATFIILIIVIVRMKK